MTLRPYSTTTDAKISLIHCLMRDKALQLRQLDIFTGMTHSVHQWWTRSMSDRLTTTTNHSQWRSPAEVRPRSRNLHQSNVRYFELPICHRFNWLCSKNSFWVTVTRNGSPYAMGPLSCLSVTLMYCGQTAGWIKTPFGGRPRPRRHCVRCGPISSRPNGRPS